MEECYDFILFENHRFAINHYKDVKIIANLLTNCGYRVAILDLYKEAEYIDDSITHLQHGCHHHLLKVHDRIPVLRKIEIFINAYLWSDYLKRVLSSVRGRYRNVYIGSLQENLLCDWLKTIPSGCSVYIWGLRSHWLTVFRRKPFSIRGINTRVLLKFLLNNKNFNFFVSDEIIQSEFIELGFEPKRCVIRPERVLQELPIFKKDRQEGTPLRLLTIGSLRPDKRIEMVLDTVQKIGDKNKLEYTVAGISDIEEYENLIDQKSRDISCVRRLNYRIPDEEFYKLLKDSDFVVLCDVKQLSSVTNGTLLESLLLGTPVIAPNYPPYSSIIGKYKVGLLFDPSSPSTLLDAINKALGERVSDYNEQLKKFQRKYLVENILQSFGAQMRESLNK